MVVSFLSWIGDLKQFWEISSIRVYLEDDKRLDWRKISEVAWGRWFWVGAARATLLASKKTFICICEVFDTKFLYGLSIIAPENYLLWLF